MLSIFVFATEWMCGYHEIIAFYYSLIYTSCPSSSSHILLCRALLSSFIAVHWGRVHELEHAIICSSEKQVQWTGMNTELWIDGDSYCCATITIIFLSSSLNKHVEKEIFDDNLFATLWKVARSPYVGFITTVKILWSLKNTFYLCQKLPKSVHFICFNLNGCFSSRRLNKIWLFECLLNSNCALRDQCTKMDPRKNGKKRTNWFLAVVILCRLNVLSLCMYALKMEMNRRYRWFSSRNAA